MMTQVVRHRLENKLYIFPFNKTKYKYNEYRANYSLVSPTSLLL